MRCGCVLASLVLTCAVVTTSQVRFTKYKGNPVLMSAPSPSFDLAGSSFPSIVYDGQTLRAWYLGWTTAVMTPCRIGYAWSRDGIRWTRYGPNAVIDLGQNGSYDDEGVMPGDICCDGGKVHLWYTGISGMGYAACYAYSSDGILWTKRPQPVLLPGPSGWDLQGIEPWTVLKEQNVWKMWYGGNSNICFATSPDCTTWTKYSANPVFLNAAHGSVLKNGVGYKMWYTNRPGYSSIGYATSSDGLSWIAYQFNPILTVSTDPSAWDGQGVYAPRVVQVHGAYFLFYSGYYNGYNPTAKAEGLAIDSRDGLVLPDIIRDMDFPVCEVGQQSPTMDFCLTNYGRLDARILKITVSSPNFRLVGPPPMPVQISEGRTCYISVAFTPKQAGSLRDSITVETDSPVLSRVVVAVTGKGFFTNPASHGILYAVSDSLYSIDLSTGNLTTIGPTGVGQLQGLTVRSSTKELYAISTSGSGSELYRVSASTGNALNVASIPVPVMRTVAFGQGDTLYGGTSLGALYRIDATTGEAVHIGSSPGKPYSALAYRPERMELWASLRRTAGGDSIYKVDTRTGMAMPVGATGDGRATPYLTFSDKGILYGLKGLQGQSNSIILIDTISAVGTLQWTLRIASLQAIAMRTDQVTRVPDYGIAVSSDCTLLENFPNPFNPCTAIRYQIPTSCHVHLEVFDILGRDVAVLVNEFKPAGTYEVRFDASSLPTGVYLYRIKAGSFSACRKTIAVK